MQISIDTHEIRRFTQTLTNLSRSALPVAVRGALNKAAFDTKQNTMPAQAAATFIQRKPTFFKANSKVEPARGFDIRSMQATVGFVPKSGTDKSVDDLQQQEKGGAILGRSFIPLAQARTSGSWNKNVRSNARISDIRKKVVDSAKSAGANNKEQFIRAAIHAGKGGFVIGTGKNGKNNKTLYRIASIVRKKNNTIVKAVAQFSVQKDRKVTPKATHFMQKASYKSGGNLNNYFAAEAQKQIDKYR